MTILKKFMKKVKASNKYFIDTNYFVRFLIDDLPEQVNEVEKLFLKASAGKVALYSSVLVMFEVKWVLSSLYSFKKSQIISCMMELLTLDFIQFEDKSLLKLAIGYYRYSNLSLEDCYHLVLSKKLQVNKIATFDKNLSRHFNKK